jgi:beta-lactamase regulating signal transducer with metallopeptidase domain/LysM repeat protein
MIEQLNTIAGAWWHWVAAMFWQVSLLIVLIACIDRLTRRWTWPQLRYALWSLVLIKLVLPPTFSLPSSVAPKLTPVVDKVMSVTADEEPQQATMPSRVMPTEATMSSIATQTELAPFVAEVIPVAPTRPAGPALDWRVYALGFWLTGSVLLAVFLSLRLRSLSKADGRASRRSSLPESFYNRVSGCAGRLGLRHLPRVVATDKVTCPAVFGVLRPVLLVPHGYLERLSRQDTEHMLLHELAHIKRGDLLAHGVYMLLQIVYWYNPLLWLVRRQIHHLRELCCDATVAGLLREDTGAYRQTLLDTARRFLATRTEPGLGLLGLFEDSNRLLIRLNWLEKPTWRYRRMKRTIVIAVVGLMLACVLPMAHSQPTVPAEDKEIPTTQERQEQFAEQMAQLELKMQQLQQQRQQLQQKVQQMDLQMAQLAQQRAQFVQSDEGEMFQVYTVQSGDTLIGIAKRFSGSDDDDSMKAMDRIMKANQLDSDDRIRVGQQLRIPLSAKEAAKIRKQFAEAERKAHETSGALANAEHALSEAEHQVAGVQSRMPHVITPATPTVPMQVEPFGLPDGDRVIDVILPECVTLVQLLDLLRTHTNLNFMYDPDQVKGDVTVKLDGSLRGSLRVGQLYQLLESALEVKNLTMSRRGDNIVAIVSRDKKPKTGLLVMKPAAPASVPAELRANAAVDADYVVKALKPGTELRIQNDIGSIKIQGGSGRDCAIKVKVEAKDATPEEAEEIAKKVVVQVTPRNDRVEIGVQMPAEFTKEQREGIQVHFDMTIPRDLIVLALQDVGDIRLADLNDSVQARTNVGAIRAQTLQGNVALTVNVGDIDVAMPADPSAKVRATTRIGAVESDLPLDITSASATRAGAVHGALGSSATGVLGTGEGKLDLTTNVGSINIHSTPASVRY